MSLFEGIEEAQVGQGGVYFLPGKYVAKILKCITLKSRKREDLFIVECEVVESDVPERKPGTRASWIVNFKQDAALGNIKGFIAAANGINPGTEDLVREEVDSEVCEYSVSPENPLAGILIRLVAVNKKTRAGGDFTLHLWEPYEPAE